MTELLWICLLTLVAVSIGTMAGFGISTIMIPILNLFMPFHDTLLFVGVIHLFSSIWKVILFKKGFEWKLILWFGISGIIASIIGAFLSFSFTELPLKRILGIFLIFYVVFLLLKHNWTVPKTRATSISGGLLSGFIAGFFGVGGAVRGAFLSAYNLPKEVYIFTSGLIALLIDISRVSSYILGGTRINNDLLYILILCVPISLLSAYFAKKILKYLPQKYFRVFVLIFLAFVSIMLIIKN